MLNTTKLSFAIWGVIFVLFGFQIQSFANPTTTGTSTTPDTSVARVSITNWGNLMVGGIPIIEESGNGNSQGMCLQLKENNHLYIGFYVTTADPLIHNYPEMYVAYNFDDTYVGVTNSFSELGVEMNECVIPGFQQNFYSGGIIFTFDLSSECAPGTILEVDYSFELVTDDGNGGYIPYPVTAHPSLFPPQVFPPSTGIVSGTKFICCHDAFDPYIGNSNDELGKVYEKGEAQSLEESKVSMIHINSSAVLEQKSIVSGIKNTSIFPNPFKGDFTIEFDNQGKEGLSLFILDALGKEILYRQLEYSETKIVVSTEDWIPGIYYLSFGIGDNFIMRKIVKIQ